MIKCVVWDIDNTLLAGTWLESGEQPVPPSPELLAVARELDARGIVHALASRNPPEAAAYVAAVTGLPFAAAECGWGRKSDAIRRIMDDLGLTADAVAATVAWYRAQISPPDSQETSAHSVASWNSLGASSSVVLCISTSSRSYSPITLAPNSNVNRPPTLTHVSCSDFAEIPASTMISPNTMSCNLSRPITFRVGTRIPSITVLRHKICGRWTHMCASGQTERHN